MVTVLVTGCGGAIGMGIIQALRIGFCSLHIIGTDADLHAASFYLKSKQYLLDKTYVVPKAEDPNYIPKIIEICQTEKVNIIFPCTDPELETLSASIDRITASGIKVIISPPETIQICRDKWLTYNHLSRHLPMTKSALPDKGIEEAIRITGLPAIIKPRKGWGSKQIVKIESIEEARILLPRIPAPIIQTYLKGVEYTIDGLTNRKGKVICIVPRQRVKVLGGLSFQGITVKNEDLIELGGKVAEHLKFIGPFNFQVSKNSEETRIVEINPRFSGTGILSVMAGANIPYLALRDILNLEIPSEADFEDGLMLLRYFGEIFVKNKAVSG